MDKIYFTQQELKTALEAKGIKDNTSAKPVIDSMVKKGVVIEGYNDGSKGSINEPSALSELGTNIKKDVSSRISNIKQGLKEVPQAYNQEANAGVNDSKVAGVIGAGAKVLQQPLNIVGQFAGAGWDILGNAVSSLIPDSIKQQGETAVKDFVQNHEGLQKFMSDISVMQQENPDLFRAAENVLNIAPTGEAKKVTEEGINILEKAGKNVIADTVKILDSLPPPDGGGGAFSGIIQTGQELVDRVPRAASRVKENITEAGVRAEKIRTSSPAVKEAIKSNLDDRIINTVTQANEPTVKAFRDVLNIAEESSQTIGTKRQPSIVGGDLASQQFDIINSQKKSVGQKIGDLSKELSKTEKVNMQDGFKQMDDILSAQGIVPQYTKKGVKLNFTGSKYTPAERTKIQELYNLALEGGENLSPSIIREKDQLFSKLKRESNFEGIGDIIIETPEGSKSLFNVFRDIYSNKLDTVSPEMKVLNNEYRKLSQLTDDIENSIFKTPNFNVTKSVDPAEFAKVNLRRIFGESQSSPAFEAVADIMDKYSRGLGYKGASPKDVAEFAQEMRKLFPETIPKTGFSGGIKTGLGDLIETVSKAGTPNYADRQKALRNLLDSLSPEKK